MTLIDASPVHLQPLAPALYTVITAYYDRDPVVEHYTSFQDCADSIFERLHSLQSVACCADPKINAARLGALLEARITIAATRLDTDAGFYRPAL